MASVIHRYAIPICEEHGNKKSPLNQARKWCYCLSTRRWLCVCNSQGITPLPHSLGQTGKIGLSNLLREGMGRGKVRAKYETDWAVGDGRAGAGVC